jgi:hypothetical protein
VYIDKLLALHSERLLNYQIISNAHVFQNILGIGGSGRSSVARLAAFMSDYEIFQIEITKNYNTTEWTEDVKNVLRKAGYHGTPTVFLFGDHQIKVSECLYLIYRTLFCICRKYYIVCTLGDFTHHLTLVASRK